MGRQSESGLPVEPVYGPGEPPGFEPEAKLGQPGEYPYTRGIYPGMYTARPWTMRQYAGFATAKESNERYHQLIAAGTTGLSVAFDLPTQMGCDSDAPIAQGEVGKVGVAIDSIGDMRELLQGIPLDRVSVSMTINAPAAVLLLLYQLVAEEQGISAGKLAGTIQNDILKEYIARGTYIYPPQPSLRLVADTFAYCRAEIPRWNTISISGYHMAEAGATAVQEIAFTLANAREYVRAAIASGLAVDAFGPRLSFFFVARTTLLEEIAKFRAARRIWAAIMRDEFGAADPRSQMLRFHTQTAGVQLTAQQPEVNLTRVTIQALAAVLGGTQSLHTNSYAVESLTDAVEAAASDLIEQVAKLGGAVAAIERGFQKAEIERSAYLIARQIDAGERVVVGVNKFTADGEVRYQPLRGDPALGQEQAKRLARLWRSRDGAAWQRAADDLKRAAAGSENLLIPLREALRAYATVGEVCDVLREVWGTYQPPDVA